MTLRIFQVFDDVFQHHHGHWQAHFVSSDYFVRWKSLIFFFPNRKYIMTWTITRKIGEYSLISICLSKDKCQRFLLLRRGVYQPGDPFSTKKCSCFFLSKEKWTKNPSRSPTRTPRSTDRVYDVYDRFQQKYPTNRPFLGAGLQTKPICLWLKTPPQDHVSLNGTWWVPRKILGLSVGSTPQPGFQWHFLKGLVLGIPDPFEMFHVILVVTVSSWVGG